MTWDTMPPEHVEEASEISRDRVEQLANNFASAVLMPASVLKRLGVPGNDTVKWLNATADALEVTATALKWRMVVLGKLDHAQAKAIPDAALGNNGHKVVRVEPPPLFSKPFMEVIALAIKQGQISARKAADVLDLTIDHLADLCVTYGVEAPFDL